MRTFQLACYGLTSKVAITERATLPLALAAAEEARVMLGERASLDWTIRGSEIVSSLTRVDPVTRQATIVMFIISNKQ
jgi:hypothetical protein